MLDAEICNAIGSYEKRKASKKKKRKDLAVLAKTATAVVYAQNFHGVGSISGIWWSFTFAVRSL